MSTGLYHDVFCKEHDTGPGHPERAERYDAVLKAFTAAGLTDQLTPIPSRDADDAELGRCHGEGYRALIKADIRRGTSSLSTGDTQISAQSEAVARRAAGGILNAVDAVLGEGPVTRAFCLLRPPGHHASADVGMGFCIYNNIAIGARHAQAAHGLKRVLIVDWDVHHGNGTQDIFYEDPSVYFFSTHQSPWYPGTGAASERGRGAGLGTTLNVPLPAGSDFRQIGRAFDEELVPAADALKPELVMISAGFDSRIGDPLGHFKLRDHDFAALTQTLRGIADRHAEGRIVSALEGGYALDGLASAATAHVKALAADPK